MLVSKEVICPHFQQSYRIGVSVKLASKKKKTFPVNWGLLYFFGYKMEFFPPKQSQKSRSISQDGSRFLGLFRKGKTRIIAKFLRADLVIYSHSREGETLSYNRINTVFLTERICFISMESALNRENCFQLMGVALEGKNLLPICEKLLLKETIGSLFHNC